MQFRGRYYFLSNFYPCSIKIDGIRYESAEAAFQGQKSRQHAHMFAGSITALNAKRLGRRIPINIREWNARRLSVMERVVRAKFEQNPQLQKMLPAGTLIGGHNWKMFRIVVLFDNDKPWITDTGVKMSHETFAEMARNRRTPPKIIHWGI